MGRRKRLPHMEDVLGFLKKDIAAGSVPLYRP